MDSGFPEDRRSRATPRACKPGRLPGERWEPLSLGSSLRGKAGWIPDSRSIEAHSYAPGQLQDGFVSRAGYAPFGLPVSIPAFTAILVRVAKERTPIFFMRRAR